MKANNQRKGPTNGALRWYTLALLLLDGAARRQSSAFSVPRPHATRTRSKQSSTELFHWANRLDDRFCPNEILEDAAAPVPDRFTRRSLLSVGISAATAALLPLAANADFAPGGTLLDREVSVTYGNPEASPSRRNDNSNVLFNQDNYYKFGAAAQWIPAGSTEFPKTMPFVRTQQRYDALKKYGDRVNAARELIGKISGAKSAEEVPERTDPAYQLRALGLLANSFLASENTGTTNELMLARWYINEAYLRIGDYRDALERGDGKEAKRCYEILGKATNSYLTLMNRSITSKVGDPFGYL